MDTELQKLSDQLDDASGVKSTERLIAKIETYLSDNAESDEAWYLLGMAYRRLERWSDALNAFQDAIAINPSSPAAQMYEHTMQIMEFYNKDMYNQ